MLVRSPRSSDEVRAAADVAEAAFGRSADLDSWQEHYALLEQVFGRDVFLVVEEGGRFVSSLACLPAQVWLHGRRLGMGAVGGVATLPDARRQGFAGAMMCAIVERMQEQGLALSALWPFSFPYYRKFGWDFACEHRSYRLAPDKLPALPEPEDVSPLMESDLPAVMEAYACYARRLVCCTDRSERWWRELLRIQGVPPFAQGARATGRMLVARKGSSIEGYAVHKLPSAERNVEVGELLALTPEARLKLLAAIAAEHSASITFKAPPGDRFRSQIPEPRHVLASLEPGFSFRVVDPAAALEILVPPAGLDGRITFALHDPARPSVPTRRYAVEVAGGVVARCRPSRPDGQSPCLECDIPTFSQVFAGYLRPAQAQWLGRLAGSNASLAFAEDLFPQWTAFRSPLEPG